MGEEKRILHGTAQRSRSIPKVLLHQKEEIFQKVSKDPGVSFMSVCGVLCLAGGREWRNANVAEASKRAKHIAVDRFEFPSSFHKRKHSGILTYFRYLIRYTLP
jgi:hypothetical protein